MTPIAPVIRWLTRAALGLLLLPALAAQADPVNLFVPYDGTGNVVAFGDPAGGMGGWVGSFDQTPPPDVAMPLHFISVVLFQLNSATQTLSGSFEFTTTDLASTLAGNVSGSYANADILRNGGQFSLNYDILSGTGNLFGATGFGLAFIDFNPLANADNNYTESGLLAFAVPEPGTLALFSLGLLAVLVRKRRPLPVN